MIGVFSAPISQWTILHGFLSYSDALLLVSLTVYLWSTPQRSLDLITPLLLPLLIVSGLICLSGMVSFANDEPYAEPTNAFKLVFCFAVLPIVILLVTDAQPQNIDRLLIAWLAGATFSALVAVASAHKIHVLGLHDPIAATGGRAQGLAYTANALGNTSALVIPVAIYSLFGTPRWSAKAILIGALVILLLALQESGSRSALLALATAIIAPTLALVARRQPAAVIIGLLTTLVILAILVTVAEEFNWDVAISLRESALGRLLGFSDSAGQADVQRQSYIEFAISHFDAAPWFGSGYGWLRVAHMHVLGMLHAGGIFGLAGLLLWAGMVTQVIFRLGGHEARQQLPAPLYRLRVLAFSGVFLWLVNGALQPVLTDRNGYVLIAVIFALNAYLRCRAPTPIGRPA